MRIFFLLSLLQLRFLASKVPIIAEHNSQIRLNIGDHLRLDCPIHSKSDNSIPASNDFSSVLYHWKVRDRLDYTLDSDPKYRFSHNRRTLELTVPTDLSDSGTYTCTGITGFGKREATFEVHVRDPNANLLCAQSMHLSVNMKAPCFLNPKLKQKSSITFRAPLGTAVKLNCQADGTEPIRYRWFMGKTVADWITTGNGARGPVLSIDQVGREHTGHYTCQVSNLAGSLNYTYRLVVTEPPSASPRIINHTGNLTFTENDSNPHLLAHVQCECDEPVIQWLKRVERGQEKTYRQDGATLISLPNARPTEQKEKFVLLGSWSGSPAFLEKIELHQLDSTGKISSKLNTDFYHEPPIPNAPRQNMFISRVKFKKPLIRSVHAGKYIVMTTSLSDVQRMEYSVINVQVMQAAAFLEGKRMLIFLLTPFSLLFVIIGIVTYVFFCQRKRSTGYSLSSSNERSILRTTDTSPTSYPFASSGKPCSTLRTSSRHSSINSQLTGKTAYNGLPGVKSPFMNTDLQQKGKINGVDNRGGFPPENHSHSNYYCQGDPQQQFYPNTVRMTSAVNGTVLTTNGAYVSANQSLNGRYNQEPKFVVPQPTPYTLQNQTDPSKCETQNSQFIYPNPYPPSHNQPQTFSPSLSAQMLTMPFAQSKVTELSYDQYSAVNQNPLSTSTMTNHYTAPFADYSIGHMSLQGQTEQQMILPTTNPLHPT